MTALETGRFYAEKGSSMFEGRYNIGFWPWELANWPSDWKDLTKLVNEVWVYCRYIYDALSPVSPVPVLVMPPAVEVKDISELSRKDFNLPEDSYLFCFSFDFHSSIYRKNPLACLDAFQKAFPLCNTYPKVGLVIKCHKPAEEPDMWRNLKQRAIGDRRIHIFEQTFSRSDLLALYRNCNCFISLHRAEGYGRGIAEALLLGLDVIATGYSGNVDFCRDSQQAKLADYRLVPIHKGEYPYGKGQYWADADTDHAARLMRECATASTRKTETEQFAFCLPTAGMKYKLRLRELWNILHQ